MAQRRIEQGELDELVRKHELWLEGKDGGEKLVLIDCDLTRSNLTGSNLSWSDLTGSDLSRSNLTGSDLDYSVLPLWCGSLKANFDDKQLIQIAYHLVKAGLNSDNASNETKTELEKLIDFANKFHRVDECGKIEPITKEKE